MMSLVAQAVGTRQVLREAEPPGSSGRAYEADAVGHEAVGTDEPFYPPEDVSTHSSEDDAMVVHPSDVKSNVTVQLSEDDKARIEEAEQLVRLLNGMSGPNPRDPRRVVGV
jgi:hypothetical protein